MDVIPLLVYISFVVFLFAFAFAVILRKDD